MIFTKEIYGVIDVAQLLGMSEGKVRGLIIKGLLHGHKINNSQTMTFLPRDIDAYLDAFVEGPAADKPDHALTLAPPPPQTFTLGHYGVFNAEYVISLEQNHSGGKISFGPYEGQPHGWVLKVQPGHVGVPATGKLFCPPSVITDEILKAIPASKIKRIGSDAAAKAKA